MESSIDDDGIGLQVYWYIYVAYITCIKRMTVGKRKGVYISQRVREEMCYTFKYRILRVNDIGEGAALYNEQIRKDND